MARRRAKQQANTHTHTRQPIKGVKRSSAASRYEEEGVREAASLRVQVHANALELFTSAWSRHPVCTCGRYMGDAPSGSKPCHLRCERDGGRESEERMRRARVCAIRGPMSISVKRASERGNQSKEKDYRLSASGKAWGHPSVPCFRPAIPHRGSHTGKPSYALSFSSLPIRLPRRRYSFRRASAVVDRWEARSLVV